MASDFADDKLSIITRIRARLQLRRYNHKARWALAPCEFPLCANCLWPERCGIGAYPYFYVKGEAAVKLVFLYGLPATGKLTVARELASITGFPLFHNHLAVDLLLPVFPFGSTPFVELREQIWLSVFEQAARSGLPGLLFTFAPEATVRPTFPAEVERLLAAAQSTVHFIELTCPLAELKRRIPAPSRSLFQKLNSLELFDQLHAQGAFHAMPMPAPELSIDTSTVLPARAALQIARTLKLPITDNIV